MAEKKIAMLTDLEVVVMKVLWDADKMLTIKEISEILSSTPKKLSVPSITQCMKHLDKKKAIKVGEFVAVKNVYARAFTYNVTRDAYYVHAIKTLQKNMYGFESADAGMIADVLVACSSVAEVEDIKKSVNK